MREKRNIKYTSPDRPPRSTTRLLLARVLRDSRGTISPRQAANSLGVSSTNAAKQLSRWAAQGWVSRVRRGLYVPVPLESRSADVAIEDAWLIAEQVFSPCYIGGWTAAEHWALTEQVFRTVLVMTARKLKDRQPVLKGVRFQVRTVKSKSLFGLKPVWRGQVKVNVSDPSRTLIDMLNDPLLGGGLRGTVDVFRTYLTSKDLKNIDQLLSYADQLDNGAVFKRLGFLLEQIAPTETKAIKFCRARLSAGNAKLDPSLPNKRLATAWRLWIPEGWKSDKA
jgi:predicted transcriptional regulator of viral defense system